MSEVTLPDPNAIEQNKKKSEVLISNGRPIRSETISKLAGALAKAQGAMDNAEKDGKGNYGKYSTLAATWDVIRKPLFDNEIAIYQRILTISGKPTMVTMLIHSSGEFFDDCELELKFDTSGRVTAMQAMGSAVTYARRYCLQAITGVAPQDDDDGVAAGNPKPQTQSNQQAKRPATSAKPPAQQTTPPKQQIEMADTDQLDMIDSLIREKRIVPADIDTILKVIYSISPKQPVTKQAAIYLITMLSDVSTDTTTVSNKATQALQEHFNRDPANYVMPIGDVAGKPIREIDEKTLKGIKRWTAAAIATVPPHENIEMFKEMNSKVTAFLKSVGVE